MATTTTTVPLPAGFVSATEWQLGDPPHRIVWGAVRAVPMLGCTRDRNDHTVQVVTSAIQYADGTIDGGSIEEPSIAIDADETQTGIRISADQVPALLRALQLSADEAKGLDK